MARAGTNDDGISATEMATLLGYSIQTITDWKAEGMPHRMKSGRPAYVVREVFRWIREREKASARSDLPDKVVEEARKMRAQADIAEMDRDERAGSLVSRAAVEKAQLAENIRTRSILLAIPGTYGQEFADTVGAPIRKCAHALDAMVRQVLETLASEDDEDETVEEAA